MTTRAWFSTLMILLAAVFVLAACGGAPSPVQITSITHYPNYPRNGGEVVFTIMYQNLSSEETFSQTTLEIVDYDEYLTYLGSTSSFNSEPPAMSGRNIVWDLGTLRPGDNGSVEVTFGVSPETPEAVFELFVDAKISATTSEKVSYSDSQRAVSNLEGHPTPTPTPSPIIDTYEEQGVTLNLPWQLSEKTLHSTMIEFDSSLLSVAVAAKEYEIIRELIHLEVFEEGNVSDYVHNFDPSITLDANIPADLQTVLKEKPDAKLVILLYDSTALQWIPCDGTSYTDSTQCSDTTIIGDYASASISISYWTSGAAWGCRGCAQ